MRIILTGEEEALRRIKHICELFREIEKEMYELRALGSGLVRLDPNINSASDSERGELNGAQNSKM